MPTCQVGKLSFEDVKSPACIIWLVEGRGMPLRNLTFWLVLCLFLWATEGFIKQVQMFSQGHRQERTRLPLGLEIRGGDEGQSVIERARGKREKDFEEGTRMSTFGRWNDTAIKKQTSPPLKQWFVSWTSIHL